MCFWPLVLVIKIVLIHRDITGTSHGDGNGDIVRKNCGAASAGNH